MELNEVALREQLAGVAQIKNVSTPGRPKALITFVNGREFLVSWETRANRFEVTFAWTSCLNTDPFDSFEEVIQYLSWKSVQVLDGVTWMPIKIKSA